MKPRIFDPPNTDRFPSSIDNNSKMDFGSELTQRARPEKNYDQNAKRSIFTEYTNIPLIQKPKVIIQQSPNNFLNDLSLKASKWISTDSTSILRKNKNNFGLLQNVRSFAEPRNEYAKVQKQAVNQSFDVSENYSDLRRIRKKYITKIIPNSFAYNDSIEEENEILEIISEKDFGENSRQPRIHLQNNEDTSPSYNYSGKKKEKNQLENKLFINEINFSTFVEPLHTPKIEGSKRYKDANLCIENGIIEFCISPKDEDEFIHLPKNEETSNIKKKKDIGKWDRGSEKNIRKVNKKILPKAIPRMKQDFYHEDDSISIDTNIFQPKENSREQSKPSKNINMDLKKEVTKNMSMIKELKPPKTTKTQELRTQKSKDLITKLERARELKKKNDERVIQQASIPKIKSISIERHPKTLIKPKNDNPTNSKEISNENPKKSKIENIKITEEKIRTNKKRLITAPSHIFQNITEFSKTPKSNFPKQHSELNLELDLEDLLKPQKTEPSFFPLKNRRIDFFENQPRISPVQMSIQRDSLNLDKEIFFRGSLKSD